MLYLIYIVDLPPYKIDNFAHLTPLTLGVLPRHLLQPALPNIIFEESTLPTCPTVAQQKFFTKRISPEGKRKVTEFPSFAKICAKVPAALAICPPRPG